jgi:hypothetical protein
MQLNCAVEGHTQHAVHGSNIHMSGARGVHISRDLKPHQGISSLIFLQLS